MSARMRLQEHLEALGSEAIAKTLELDFPVDALVKPTQDTKHGDYQLNGAMALGKRLKRPPRELAEIIVKGLQNDPAVASATVAGPGFINLTLDDAWISKNLSLAIADLERDGVTRTKDPSKIVVDFSSPNIAKQMHVGHLRSTIIGDSIARLLDFVGYDVIRDNHIGDWGTQFGLLIVGMRQWGDAEALEKTPIVELERVYKLASEKAKNEEAFAQAARDELAKLQSGDAENHQLWQRFVEVSRKALDDIYERLGVSFDMWRGESAYHDALPAVVNRLLEEGIAREDQGAICIFWDEQKEVPKALKKQKAPFIIQKRDGAFLYSTTDIATVLYRRDELQAERSIYVVDSRQSLHFHQLFAVIAMLNVEMTLEHVGFGTVLGNDGKPLRTRDASGQVITLASLLDEATMRAKERIDEGVREGKLRIGPDEIDHVAKVVGIGAVKYADLRQNRLSDYQFDWDKMISFNGNAGPYLQYAYARCQSIFKKGGIAPSAIGSDFNIVLNTSEEKALGRQLLRFGDVVHKAAETNQPHLVCEHLYDLARSFSGFYASCPVLTGDEKKQNSRLALVALVARQLKRGLNLVGINVLDSM